MQLEKFHYDNKIVRNFGIATVLWGIIGMTVGLLAAFQLFTPDANLGNQYTTFGRIRPLHTNAVIFAFVGNGIFMGVYYSLQRLLKARMFSDILSKVHFWGWQLIILAAAITLPLGFTTSHEYAELEWPIDIAITIIWVVFGINMFGTIINSCCSAYRKLLSASYICFQKLLLIRRSPGCSCAVVVWPQCGRIFPNYALPRYDVLFLT